MLAFFSVIPMMSAGGVPYLVRAALAFLTSVVILPPVVALGFYPTPQTLSVIMEYGSAQMDVSLLHDLMDLRVLIECECARLACENGAGPADTELDVLLGKIKSGTGTELVDATFDYHYHLTKLSGNDVYAMTFKAFHGPLRGLTAEHFRAAKERRQSLQLHTELTRALHEGVLDTELVYLERAL